MTTARNKGRLAFAAAAVGVALALSGCASGDPLDSGSGDAGGSDDKSITVGSQAYYSNEIVAEIYSQALENAGYTVKRQFQIGQRDAYIPALEDGEVDLIPEYTGNLLQYYDPSVANLAPDEVYSSLTDALPDGLAVLDAAPATDQDTYTVTSDFAEKNGVASIADLAKVSEPLTIGANAEFEERPYSPAKAKEVYGVDLAFQATGDSTLDSLLAGTIQVADIYTTDPGIKANNLVTLTDPDGLILVQNVVPLLNADLSAELADILNPISAKLTTDELIDLNTRSTADQESSDTIATDWLTENGFLK